MEQTKLPAIFSPILLVLILFLACLMQTTNDLYVPALPIISAYFHTTDSIIQLTITFFMIGLGLSHLIYGPLSDRIGRKPPILFGIGLSIVGSLICFLAPTVIWLIIGRFFQGLGIGVCNSVGRSLIRDVLTDRLLAKIGSYVGMVSVVILALSPTLGGYITQYFGWHANFLFLFVFGLIIWFATYKILPETNNHLNRKATELSTMRKNYLTLLRSKVFMGYLLCACFAYSGIAAYITAAPFIMQQTLHLTLIQFGWLSSIIATAIFLSGLINSLLVIKEGIPVMVGYGVGAMTMGGLSMLLLLFLNWMTLWSIMLPVGLFSLGAGLTFINAFAGAFHPFPTIAGTAGALYAASQDLSAALISALIALLQTDNPFLLATILSLLGIFSLLAWRYLATANQHTII